LALFQTLLFSSTPKENNRKGLSRWSRGVGAQVIPIPANDSVRKQSINLYPSGSVFKCPWYGVFPRRPFKSLGVFDNKHLYLMIK
jgi:hypothetical protein